MRIETDFLGKKELPDTALYGIHSLRARDNFPDRTAFSVEWYKALGLTKKACYLCYKQFIGAKKSKFPDKQFQFPEINYRLIDALIKAADEVADGKNFDAFIVPAIQGGAGTSINMNINEIIANRANQILGGKPGDYHLADPFEHANVFQSTNDVVPSALRIALMRMLNELEEKINNTRGRLEYFENNSRFLMRTAYTQMQAAVPSSYGMLFSAYNEALSRDWWRVSKCFERIKTVNLGGGAAGTGISIPRYFIMEVVPILKSLCKLPIARSENLVDTTSNLDSFVEVHAILKAHAVNLEKMVADLRLLASDLSIEKDIELPQKQVGSSIMPGKVNPVIPEFVISVSHQVYANDQLVSGLSAQGTLDLNAYLPIIGNKIIESLHLLIAANKTLKNNVLDSLFLDESRKGQVNFFNPSLSTALSPLIGYHKASQIAKEMIDQKVDVFQANQKLKYIKEDKLRDLLQIDHLLKLGFSLNDLID